jgi:hypothetical protein
MRRSANYGSGCILSCSGHLGVCAALLTLLYATGGCVDVRNFEGSWEGKIVPEPAVRQGFTESTTVEALELSNVDLERLTASLTTSDGKFKNTPLTRMTKFSNDTLASLTFDGDPLRTYLLFAPLTSESEGSPALMVISLFGDDRVEMRILRSNDLFGVFNLYRKE